MTYLKQNFYYASTTIYNRTNMNHLHQRMFCAKFGRNLPLRIILSEKISKLPRHIFPQQHNHRLFGRVLHFIETILHKCWQTFILFNKQKCVDRV